MDSFSIMGMSSGEDFFISWALVPAKIRVVIKSRFSVFNRQHLVMLLFGILGEISYLIINFCGKYLLI